MILVSAQVANLRPGRVPLCATCAIRDEASGNLKTIGKAYSGLTDIEIETLTQHFLAHTLEKHGRYHVVIPDIGPGNRLRPYPGKRPPQQRSVHALSPHRTNSGGQAGQRDRHACDSKAIDSIGKSVFTEVSPS